MAKKTLESFSDLEKEAYNNVKSFVQEKMDIMVDVQRMILRGEIKADPTLQKPFMLVIQGMLGVGGKPYWRKAIVVVTGSYAPTEEEKKEKLRLESEPVVRKPPGEKPV